MMFELPYDFPHQPPEGHKYEAKEHKRNVISIWLRHPDVYAYTSDPVSTIWGFYHQKKKEYYAPINSEKRGDKVDISNTRPWTAMQLNLNPLEAAFV